MRVRTKSSRDWYLHKSSSSPSVLDTFHCSDPECRKWVRGTITVQNLTTSFDFPCTVIRDENDTDLGGFSFIVYSISLKGRKNYLNRGKNQLMNLNESVP